MAAQEVIGHTPSDPVKLDALPDRVAIPRHTCFMQRQHFRGQHLELQRYAKPVLHPPRTDPDKDLACDEHFPRGATLQAIEIRQPLGIRLVRPGEPKPLQLFLLCRINQF